MRTENRFVLEFDKQSNRIHFLDYSTTDKFQEDKLFVNTKDLLFILDGVVLNKTLLLNESHSKNWKQYLIDSYAQNKSLFFDKLKGSYWGVVVDKINGEIVVFSDHIGSKQLFYSGNKNTFIVSNNSHDLTQYLKEHRGITPSLNERAAYFILTMGYVIEDMTIVNEIKRLMPGHYLQLRDSQEQVLPFHFLKKRQKSISDREAIEGIDYHFRNAIRNSFEKDVEYGYKHLTALSGGLDSRMTTIVSHELGYKDQLNITFSQTGYLDELTAKKIAADLKHDWIFKSLDNGTFLKSIDEVTALTGGNTTYFGIGHGLSLLDKLDFRDFGMLHSGQFGNSIVGTFGDHHTKLDGQFTMSDIPSDAIAKEYIHSYRLKAEYQDFELFKNYNHCMISGNNGLLPAQCKSETFSPFYDLDLWEFCLSIPTKQRAHHHLYKMWINQKYPKAANYIWEQTKAPLNARGTFTYNGASYSYRQLWKFVLRKANIKSQKRKSGLASKYHMNPVDYWLSINEELSNFWANYVKENLNYLDETPELRQYAQTMAQNGNSISYVRVLTLLSAAKLIGSHDITPSISIAKRNHELKETVSQSTWED